MPSPQFPPARDYKWKDFEPGNTAALKHGARSTFRISEVAEQAMEWLRPLCPWIVSDLDLLAVDRLCRVEARARLAHAAISQIANDPEHGREAIPEYLLRMAAREDALADRLATGLGMTPEGRSKLARDTAVAHHYAADALAGLQAEGRRLVEAHEARSAAAVNGQQDGPQGDSVPPETAS